MAGKLRRVAIPAQLAASRPQHQPQMPLHQSAKSRFVAPFHESSPQVLIIAMLRIWRPPSGSLCDRESLRSRLISDQPRRTVFGSARGQRGTKLKRYVNSHIARHLLKCGALWQSHLGQQIVGEFIFSVLTLTSCIQNTIDAAREQISYLDEHILG